MPGEIEKQRFGVRNQIIGLHSAGHTVKEICNVLGVHKNTVRMWVERFEHGESMDRRHGGGQPKVTNNDEDERILAFVRNNPRATAKNVLQEVQGLRCSERTIQLRLNQSGLHSRVAARKPEINEMQKLQRLQFCMQYRDRDVDFWKK